MFNLQYGVEAEMPEGLGQGLDLLPWTIIQWP